MNRALLVLAAAWFAIALPLDLAAAAISISPVRGHLGHLVVDATTGKSAWSLIDATSSVQTVYDALSAPANFAIAADHNNGVEWGDSVHLDRSGTLDEISFTFYNGAGATLDSASIVVGVGDPATHQLLGAWTLAADFVPEGGLPDGWYATLAIQGLSASAVHVGGWMMVVQRVLSSPGFPFGLGVVSCTPPSVGSSPPTMYCSQILPWSDPATGFFRPPGYVADPGYRLRADVAAGATATTWGRLKHLYR